MSELSQWLPIIAALLVAGSLAGTLAGLLGVGGGIVNVPVLFFLFQHFGVDTGNAMLIATGTSLATIVPTSIASIRSHHKRNNIDWLLIRRWLLFIIAGVLLGSSLLILLDGRYFTLLFALIALFMAFNLYFRSNSAAFFPHLPQMPWQGLFGSVIGFFSVMAGIGGGTLGVSILTSFNVNMYRAVGTSAVFGLLVSLPGTLFLFASAPTPLDAPVATWGYINLLALLILVPLSVLCAPFGVYLGAKLDGVKLKKIFALLLVLTAIRMLWQLI